MSNPDSSNAQLMCRRDAQGRIVALTQQALTPAKIKMGAWQTVLATDPEVDTFMLQVSRNADALSQSDIGLARVLEDLIDTLIDRGLLQFTDLPDAAQAKLLERRQTRAKLPNRLELLSDDSDGDGVRL